MESVQVESYAKINIGLRITGKRSDGFHDIETLFQAVGLHDTITFSKTQQASINIHTSHKTLPLNSDNLMCRAFDLFRSRTGIKPGLDIHIEKRIPMGGGLGGGSSNAAATLCAANTLWKGTASPEELETMALELGSDVPFFLAGGTAIGKGRGEILSRAVIPSDWYCILVCPGIHISTKWAYSQVKFTLTNGKKITNFNALFSGTCPDQWKHTVCNDLEEPVFNSYPELKEIKKDLYKAGAFYASMSGSGSTVYGLFHEKQAGQKAEMFFSNRCSAYLCRPVAHPPCESFSLLASIHKGGGRGDY